MKPVTAGKLEVAVSAYQPNRRTVESTVTLHQDWNKWVEAVHDMGLRGTSLIVE